MNSHWLNPWWIFFQKLFNRLMGLCFEGDFAAQSVLQIVSCLSMNAFEDNLHSFLILVMTYLLTRLWGMCVCVCVLLTGLLLFGFRCNTSECHRIDGFLRGGTCLYDSESAFWLKYIHSLHLWSLPDMMNSHWLNPWWVFFQKLFDRLWVCVLKAVWSLHGSNGKLCCAWWLKACEIHWWVHDRWVVSDLLMRVHVPWESVRLLSKQGSCNAESWWWTDFDHHLSFVMKQNQFVWSLHSSSNSNW